MNHYIILNTVHAVITGFCFSTTVGQMCQELVLLSNEKKK